MKRFTKRMAVPMVAVGMVAVAACGTTGTSKETSKNQAYEEQDAVISKLMERPTELGLSEKITQPIPKGKTIAFIQCGAPSCLVNGDALEAAAKTVGWKVDRINTDGSAESVKAAWAQANESNPDAVVASGFTRKLFEDELAKLAEKDIPVINQFVVEPPEKGITAAFGYGDQWNQQGKILADYMLANSGDEEVNALSVTISAYPNLGLTSDGLAEEIKDNCSKCSVDQLGVPVDSMGSDLPTRITSHLAANPDINWMYVGFADMLAGLPAALDAAGLGDVHVVTTNNTATTTEYLKNGESLVMGTGFDNLDFMWRSVDFLIRHYLKMSTAENQDPENLPSFVWTKENLPEDAKEGSFSFVVDAQEEWKTLWGVK